jgi:predicted phosphodiesterase
MANKNYEILVIPDVHGRDFWREPVKYTLENTDARIVFLGDFCDPYPTEFEKDFDYRKKAIEGLREIIEMKKQLPDRITLLLGNHDSYMFNEGKNICDCRTDHRNYNAIQKLFQDNKDLFQLADEATINGRHFIFSHAGIHKGYVKFAFPDEYEFIDDNNVVTYFNNAYLTEEPKVIKSLGMYDKYRGLYGYDYGSIVWADIYSWLSMQKYDGYGDYQIVGHTQLVHGSGGLIDDKIADLDSSEAFVITDEGEIKQYNKLL